MRTGSPEWITPVIIVSECLCKVESWIKHTTFDDTRNHGSDEGNGKGVIDMEFERSVGIIVAVVR